MARIDTGKVKTSALKQGSSRTKTIKGKQYNYKPGKTKSTRVQKIRPASVYTKKFNTKKTYMYNLMTKQEKMHVYDKERKAILREIKNLERLGYEDAYMEAVMNIGADVGKYAGQIPTARQQEWMSQTYGGLGAFRGKSEIEKMVNYKNELRKLRKEIARTIDPVDEAFSKIITKLKNILAVESAQGRYKSGTGSYKSLDAAKAEQLLEFVEDIESGLYGKDAKEEFAKNVLEQWDKIERELDEYIYNMYASYDDLTGKSTTEYLALIERLLPNGDPTINRLQEQENERSRVSNGWY